MSVQPDQATPTSPCAPPTHRRPGTGRALLRAVRPRQWTKNGLVLVAPLASGALGHPEVLGRALIAFVGFTLVASGVYLANDLADVDLDRAHPTRCHRPIAAGDLPVPVARAAAAVLLVAGMALGFVDGWALAAILGTYAAASLAYSWRLKREPLVELGIVASGFFLRAVAGAVATGVLASDWFLLTAGFASLFVVAGKRYAELRMSEATGRVTRPVLSSYTDSYLRFVWTVSAGAVMVTYALWAFSNASAAGSRWSDASTVPFTFALLRYAAAVDDGRAGEPEEIILGDKVLLGAGIALLGCLLASVYLR
ncbi:MAG: decaprenyl-phosphate phosphoribosyltransferase [Nostocoides sp.]